MNALLWIVDIQNDFMLHEGKLNVPEAEKIIPNIEAVIKAARGKGLQLVFTADWHFENSKELSENPDFINTFSEHCMAESHGAEIINNLSRGSRIMEWTKTYTDKELSQFQHHETTIQKDAFDVFAGNPNASRFIELSKPDHIYVIGVAGNVCVHQAVTGFINKNIPVTVFSDCIKDLPIIPSCVDKWKSQGVRVTSFNQTYF